MYKVQRLIWNYNILKQLKWRNLRRQKNSAGSFKTHNTASLSGIRRQSRNLDSVIFLSELLCSVDVYLRSGHHSKLKVKSSFNTLPVEVLQCSCFTHSQTCCTGGPHHRSDLHRGKQRKWRPNENTEAHGRSGNTIHYVPLLRLPTFSMDLWGRHAQM